MNSKINLKEDNNSKDTVYIHPTKAERMKIEEGVGTFNFGTQTSSVKIIITTQYNENELSISSNIVNNLKIPLFCEFDLINDQQNLRIGPFIGILAKRTKNKLRKNLNAHLKYLYHYDQIGGAIMVFSLDEVSSEDQTIQGFMYNPVNKKWEKGLYNYPSSLFSRITWFGTKWPRHFESFMGQTIFNNFYYNKWTVYNLLKKSPELTNHVPKTILYTKPSDILTFLEKNPSAYLKPKSSSRGQGIMRIDMLGQKSVQVKYFKNGKVTQETLNGETEINSFFRKKLKSKKFMIQKTIDLASMNNGIMDFRMYLTKDSNKEWKYITIFSRHGISGEIVSNIDRGGASGMGLQRLKEALSLSDQEVKEIENKMITVAKKAVKAIEKSGVHFANTGIDIGIDNNKRVWIIEVQASFPGQKGFLQDKTLYHEYLKTIMQYAKKLAGF